MVDISILDSIIQSFFLYFGIIVVYNHIFKRTGIKMFIKSSTLLILLSLIGCLLDDMASVIFLLAVVIEEKIRFGKLIFSHLNVLLTLLSGQTLVFSLAAFLSESILSLSLGIVQVNGLSKFSHVLVGIDIVIICVFDLIALRFVYSILKKQPFSMAKLQSLKIDKRLFVFLLVLFGSIELLLLVGNIQGVTATIQFTLLIVFILMIGLMSWQMIEMIQVYTRQQQLENEKQQNEQLSTYLKSVEQQYLELRKFKHDYKNLIVSLNTQTDMGKVKDYLIKANHNNVLETSLNDAKIAQVEQLKDTAIRGLVVQKFFYAKKCGVELNVETLNEAFQISEAVTIVVRVIGNLLDNAIEQAQKMADKSVIIAFNKIDDMLEISVRNAIDSTFNQQQIFKTGYSTKGQNRGLGLANVRELVGRQRQFHLDIESKAGYVTMTLIIMEDE